MSWTLFVLLLSSILQTGLVGRSMFGVSSWNFRQYLLQALC